MTHCRPTHNTMSKRQRMIAEPHGNVELCHTLFQTRLDSNDSSLSPTLPRRYQMLEKPAIRRCILPSNEKIHCIYISLAIVILKLSQINLYQNMQMHKFDQK